ncbi:MAG: S8 family serine peptidase, partial [Nocardioides sp.]|nr:S8 family serine peptidase [Nocardioides sp.]
PDPGDDGCSTADVVSAIDAAVRDRVDVLNLSMSGLRGLDTVDYALLGAAEADIPVAMAAGNGHDQITSAQPWTTVVGASTGPDRRGELRLSNGSSFKGVMAAKGIAKTTPLVPGASVPAPGRTRAQARLCLPGSLDAARVNGKIVLCERGRIARVDKSAAVKLADGVAMVLVNAARRPLSADFHSVPTLHVSASEGDRLRRELRAPSPVTGRLVRVPDLKTHPRVLPWSARGRPDRHVVEPSLVSPGFGLLAATSGSGDGSSWELLSGTSASTATVSGLSARLRARHPEWTASRIRSALMTSATSAGQITPLAQGSGVASPARSLRPGLSFDLDPARYRRMLERDEDPSTLNLPSVMASQTNRTIVVTREVTNTDRRHMYYSSSTRGFGAHRVSVTPAAVRMAPGETREFQIRIVPRPGTQTELASGWVSWHGANGARVRIPVVLPR